MPRHFRILILLAATCAAQPTGFGIESARRDCQSLNNSARDETVAKNPALKSLSDACSAFRASPGENTAAKVAAAWRVSNPVTLMAQERLAALEAKAAGASGLELFYQLANLAKSAFDAGDLVKARSYAGQLLAMAPQYPGDWNYGNAIYFGHMVLGRVELTQGNTVLAENHLLQSAQTPGSPQLNSFGPNTSLARDLLEKNETTVVLQYFALLPKFWKLDFGKVAEWTAQVKAGHIPDFGANLMY
jgi:hypothetical protein